MPFQRIQTGLQANKSTSSGAFFEKGIWKMLLETFYREIVVPRGGAGGGGRAEA